MIFNLLFPRKCLGCGREGSYFCSDCLNWVYLKEERICPYCGFFSAGGKTHLSCFRPLGLDGLTSIFAYQGVIKKAIKKLKYKFVSDLAKEMVDLFLSFCGEDKVFSDFCLKTKVVLVPIPLHPKRLKWRGFNQAELLGRLIAQNLGLEFAPDLLLRVKNTKPQVELNKKERQENIRNAFRVNLKFKIKNFKIILFDDVWTTGATLKEACRVLKRRGVKEVWGLTLAR